MDNIFEMTMAKCQEDRSARGTGGKKIVEARLKPITEADEQELGFSPEEDRDMGAIPDPEAEDNMEMGDIQDGVLAVIDPEKSADEVQSSAEDAQKIIDDTPEGEVPSTDEYIGDKAYTCPICGNAFFVDTEMKDGDECPICRETPDGFVFDGDIVDNKESGDPEAEEGTADEDLPKDEEVPEEDGEDGEDDLPPDDEDEELECFDRKPVSKITRTEAINKSIRRSRPVMRPRFQIDESTFNPYMSRFIRENYKNARSFKITGATLNKNNILTMECVITFKSGKTKNVSLKTEGFREFNGKRAYIDFKEDGAFKTESKSKISPFIFTTSMKDNVLKCEGLSYNFISKISENKISRIKGKVVLESRNFRRGDRK